MTILEATRETFAAMTAGGLVLVDLWGPDCASCLALMPDVERLDRAHPELKVVKLEAPKARRLCMELKVMGLPAFLLLRDGAEVSRLAGPSVTAGELASWLEAAVGTPGGVPA